MLKFQSNERRATSRANHTDDIYIFCVKKNLGLINIQTKLKLPRSLIFINEYWNKYNQINCS